MILPDSTCSLFLFWLDDDTIHDALRYVEGGQCHGAIDKYRSFREFTS